MSSENDQALAIIGTRLVKLSKDVDNANADIDTLETKTQWAVEERTELLQEMNGLIASYEKLGGVWPPPTEGVFDDPRRSY